MRRVIGSQWTAIPRVAARADSVGVGGGFLGCGDVAGDGVCGLRGGDFGLVAVAEAGEEGGFG